MNKTTRSGIYAIKNTVNGKVYIGSSVNMKSRWHTHKAMLKKDKHHSSKLQNAWNKYGEKTFVFYVLEAVIDNDAMLAREQDWLNFLDSIKRGYNVCLVAGNCLGIKHTKATRRKVSLAGMGRIPSAETRAKISKANKGKIMPIEMREHLSRVNSNPSAEVREANAAAHRGKIHSEEAKRKMSKARKGVPKTKEHAQKIGDAQRGIKLSMEVRARMSEGQKGRVASEETRQKHSIAHRNITQETRDKMSASRIGKGLGADNPMYGRKHTPETRAKIVAALIARRERMRA